MKPSFNYSNKIFYNYCASLQKSFTPFTLPSKALVRASLLPPIRCPFSMRFEQHSMPGVCFCVCPGVQRAMESQP